MAVNIGKMQKLTSPNPFALLSTRKEDGNTNLMAISWWTYASNHPATIAVCLSKRGFSSELIAANGEFGLSIVDESLKESAFLCGTCSGRTVNKAEEFNIPLMDSQIISAKLVKAHRVAIECRVVNTIEVSDHMMFIAEVVETHFAEEKRQLFAFNGYGTLDTI